MDTTNSSTVQPTTGNGWTCGQCGVFVTTGTMHACRWQWTNPAPLPVPTFTVAPARLSDEDVDRIARRVVEMLKEADA